MARNRRSNLAFAARSAASASTSSLRARLAAANSRSPISSKISRDGAAAPSAGRAVRGRRRGLAHLREFLGHLVGGLAGVLPVEADTGRALAELVGAHQRGQRLRHAPERAVAPPRLRALRSRALSSSQAALCSAALSAPPLRKNVRVAPHQLVADRRSHRLEIELARLAGDLRVKHHLEQQIAQLFLEMLEVSSLDGVGNLVRLLDRVGRNAREGLLPIPRAATRERAGAP